MLHNAFVALSLHTQEWRPSTRRRRWTRQAGRA